MLHGSKRIISIQVRYYKPRRSLFLSSHVCSATFCSHRLKPIESDQPAEKNIVNLFEHILRQCSTIHQAKETHTQIIITRSDQYAFLAARLITVYAQFGFLAYAKMVFQGIPIEHKSNLLLWNSMLRATQSYGYFAESLRLYRKMRNVGIMPDGFTFPLLVRACASIGNLHMCKLVHGHVLVSGFQFHVHVANELIGMFGKLGFMDHARKVFDGMQFRSCISWNSLISGFSKNYNLEDTINMFKCMELEGMEPNLVAWTSLLSAHARCGKFEDVLRLFREMRLKRNGATAEAVAVVLSVCADFYMSYEGIAIHGYVITGGFQDYMFVNNSLICLYGKHGNMEDSSSLFRQMKAKNLITWNSLISSLAEAGLCDEAFEVFSQLEKSGDSMLQPNVITWTTVISGFSSKGRGNECLDMFRRMLYANVDPNSVTFASVLSACGELAILDRGREIHGHSIRSRLDDNILVGNGLINMYMKCGKLKEAQIIFNKLGDRDLVSWNSMIAGYGMHGFGEDCLLTFRQMVEVGQRPDEVTFVAVLSACSHAGLVTEGQQLFDQMVNMFSIQPLMEHYACMVDLLGRAGLLQEACDIVKNMPMEPNVCVWGALLNSCQMYKNTDLAEVAASKIFSLETRAVGSYILLSNLYAACGSWQNSAKVRMLAKTKGLKKNPGQSWIEVQNKVHTFLAGNALQPGLEEVYHVLGDLGLKMETGRYITDGNAELHEGLYNEDKLMVSANY
ncbi:hypothetical protein Syun_026395 [Stephania yunnanensis]|uniref:Pentatricopeptide repeat-containing protein n=1 Tax=Stephania yunnanensis TaxID=152371 RepID=A0AAP0EW43_9MAGN